MKKIFLFLFFSLFVGSLQAQENIDPYKNIKYLQLDNGLQVYLLADKEAVNTQISVDVKVGMSIEDEETAGISHLLEHLIFRDQRVPHNDFLDYLKDAGATYVNGYTREDSTQYVATIQSEKSEFLVKTFAQMLFDKNVSIDDLEIERGALQTEIGDAKWHDHLLYPLFLGYRAIKNSFPDDVNIFTDSFGLQKQKERPPHYIYKLNNHKFTLDAVMQHYKEYYYPANMTLKIAGNFDLENMIQLIQKEYGTIKFQGVKHTQELAYDAKLEPKEYKLFWIANSSKNRAYIGSRYILDDYKKYLILNSYSEFLAQKMQQLLRNKLGQTYSVSAYDTNLRNAALVGVSFDSLHDNFEENLQTIQKQIQNDVVKMDEKDIVKALEQSKLYYTSIEHDSNSLMDLIDTTEYIRVYQHIEDKTPYEVFNSIDINSFQKVISDSFIKQYGYLYTYQDYYFFPYDLSLLYLIIVILLIVGMNIFYRVKRAKEKKVYSQRDIIFTRRLGTRFVSVVWMFVVVIIANFIASWIEYYLFLVLFDNPYFGYTLSAGGFFLYFIFSTVLFFIVLVFLFSTVYRNFAIRLDVTKERLNIIGANYNSIDKEDIEEIKIVPYSIKNYFQIRGNAFFFLKPLVMVKEKGKKEIYLRCKNAQELYEDIVQWRES
ncbi:M16 family metallopeptidase [Sulfurimonas sp.]|uniref:M16 family metallopeptidase n=1 Tax=Sulfurimonas sp. TaxID=2022749 RepID=UPI003D09AEA7